jgi:hypothetical protein
VAAGELRHAEDHMLLLGRRARWNAWLVSFWKWIAV